MDNCHYCNTYYVLVYIVLPTHTATVLCICNPARIFTCLMTLAVTWPEQILSTHPQPMIWLTAGLQRRPFYFFHHLQAQAISLIKAQRDKSRTSTLDYVMPQFMCGRGLRKGEMNNLSMYDHHSHKLNRAGSLPLQMCSGLSFSFLFFIQV